MIKWIKRFVPAWVKLAVLVILKPRSTMMIMYFRWRDSLERWNTLNDAFLLLGGKGIQGDMLLFGPYGELTISTVSMSRRIILYSRIRGSHF